MQLTVLCKGVCKIQCMQHNVSQRNIDMLKTDELKFWKLGAKVSRGMQWSCAAEKVNWGRWQLW